MAPKNRPYEQFGSYILFKKMESDSLGDLWRAGQIEGSQLGPVVALRRLSGGDREAFTAAATTASAVAPMLTGTSFVRNQVIGVANSIPFVAYEYSGGRSLRHIVDRARGGQGLTPNPIPIEQAIVIAEKVALSLATLADMRFQNVRLMHGSLIPQFIWISDDGEIRVGGQGLGKGLVASLRESRVASELARYIAPEEQSSGEPSKGSEVYAMGAILYLLVTGVEPPDPISGSAFAQSIRGAKSMSGEQIPEDIRTIVEKSLVVDPAGRYASIAEMKQAISTLAHGGNYSATTFNLAFYLSSLLKKEMEGEAIDRDRESKVNVSAYVEQPSTPAAERPPVVAPTFGVTDEPKKSKAPLMLIAAGVVAVLGIGGWFATRSSSKATPAATASTATTTTAPAAPPPPVKPQVISEPIVAATTTSPTATVDPAAQKKAFEAAVNQKLQEEMMKLQTDYTNKLQAQQARNAPVPAPAPSSSVASAASRQSEERGAPSAAALDEQHRLASRQEATATVAPAQPAPVPVAAVAVTQTVAAAPPPVAAPTVREGDVVEITALDRVPSPTSPIRVHYPPMAMTNRIQTTVIVTALISETGNVLEVRVLRGDPRFGFNDEAIRAMKAARFSVPTKDGKRVKTWRPQTIAFTL